MIRASPRLLLFGFGLLMTAGRTDGALQAQDLTDLVAGCGAASHAHFAWCRETALAVQAAQAGLGLSASGGMDLPGSASTLGWRTKGSPRFAVSVWGSLTRAPLPALNSVDALPAGEVTPTIPSLHVSGTVGLFDGFSLGPTAGGFGSLDLTLAGQWTREPDQGGFQKGSAGWGVGARLGILRESFSLPGLTVTAFHRFLGDHTLWSIAEGDPAEASFDLRVSSLRGMLGKDLQGIGLVVGLGWDRYLGDADIMVRDPEGGSLDAAGTGTVRSTRRVAFVGASRTFLTLQISGEIGWGEGFSPSFSDPMASSSGAFDPNSSSYFGSLACRLTF